MATIPLRAISTSTTGSSQSGKLLTRQQASEYTYEPFSEVLEEDVTLTSYMMFTGRRFDTEIRLYYYRARYYSTEIGRFLQVDPIGYEESMNLYIYVGNNHILLVEPSGQSQEASMWWDGNGNGNLILNLGKRRRT